ncbi:hypothetical protein Hypma_007803 [Hypsizygus marmoreus]|uniref:Uncharacterized protein n=1 Tax=Hypsizygus marmoreus TaxID=39966 RepID=A0A369JY88_HYPMA|nr:hypothetical protein Hypma_007803 [Hypsizygus marmoreus]
MEDGAQRLTTNNHNSAGAYQEDDDLWNASVPHEHTSIPQDTSTLAPAQAIKWGHLTPDERARRQIRFDRRMRAASGSIKKVSARRRQDSTPLPTSLVSDELSVAASGWIGTCIPREGEKEFTVDELCGPEYNMKLIDWDGCLSRPILDVEARVVGVLAGRPRGSDWDATVDQATRELAFARESLRPSDKDSDHRRGKFPALVAGISFGGGQTKPANLHSSKVNKSILDGLLHGASKSFSRIAMFASSMLECYAPRVFASYRESLDALLAQDPTLAPNFHKSVFAAATFNLGPSTVTRPHLDRGNLAWGWCSITALGSFDPDFGGHLVLWDLGLVIRFPAGSTILIPSAVVKHSNVKIRGGDVRCSFTQYTSGGLLRWVYNGFCTDKDLLAHAKKEGKEEEVNEKRKADRAKRWAEGLEKFSKVENSKFVY